MKTSGTASKSAGGKTAESNVKPSEMLLDLNDDCEFVTNTFFSKSFLPVDYVTVTSCSDICTMCVTYVLLPKQVCRSSLLSGRNLH